MVFMLMLDQSYLGNYFLISVSESGAAGSIGCCVWLPWLLGATCLQVTLTFSFDVLACHSKVVITRATQYIRSLHD